MSPSSPERLSCGLATGDVAVRGTNYDVNVAYRLRLRICCERISCFPLSRTRVCDVTLIVVLFLIHCVHYVTSTPTITDFSALKLRIFRDENNPEGYYNTLFVDSMNSGRLLVGALDFVYGLNASDIQQAYQKSDNLTSHLNYSATYATNVGICWLYGDSDIPNKVLRCRNHARAVFPISATNEIYVCSTGAYKPQEYYLNNNLQVVSVERRSNSGNQKCPFDPFATYAAVLVDDGNPYNFSSLYTGVATGVYAGYINIFRSPLYSDRYFSSPPAFPLSTNSPDVAVLNTNNGVYVVNTFNIGNYVYYFFRELALESTWLCNPTYYSRVARVCKNDLGGRILSLNSRFTSFFKARLSCSVAASSSDIPFNFNEVYDVIYNATSQQFYALFMTNHNGQWGSAVCQYSLSSVNNVFNNGLWVEQTSTDSAWLPTQPGTVPTPRPGQCIGSSLEYDTSTSSFIKSHPLMKDVIGPTTGIQPSYYSKELAFQKLEVSNVNGFIIFYLYSPALAELHRVSVFVDSTGQTRSNEISIWKPFEVVSTSPPVIVWNMLLNTDNQKSSLYMTTNSTVVQMSIEQCDTYQRCTECVLDPYCGWSLTAASCMAYQPGYVQATNQSQALSVCRPNCTNTYKRTSVIPGMSLYLNCSSTCSTDNDNDITWYHQSNNNGLLVQVSVDTDSDYLLSKDNGLVILSVNRTKHIGRFQCQVGDVVLTQHDVSLSVCNYGDDLRDVWLNEYVNYCRQFDDYVTEYRRWQCAQKLCVLTNCTAGIEKCGLT